MIALGGHGAGVCSGVRSGARAIPSGLRDLGSRALDERQLWRAAGGIPGSFFDFFISF